MLKIARVGIIVMGFLAIIVAAYSPGIIDLINFVCIINVGGLVVPVVGGILWKRANLKAGLSAFLSV